MADEIIQDPLEAANYLLRQYRDNPDFEFTQEEASLVHGAYGGGVSFVDSKPVMDEASTSSFLRSQDESDPTFIASPEEFSILKATEPSAISRIAEGAAGAAEYFKPVITEGIPELIKTASMREPRPGEPSLPATLLEAGARGTMDVGMMAAGASKFIEKAPYMAAGALGLQDDYKSYLNQKTIDQNYQMQAIDKINAERATGKSIIGLPEGTFAPKAAEAASMVLDPTLAVPFVGPGAKATAAGGRALRAGTRVAGGIETAARATGGAIDLGVEKIGETVQRVLPGVSAPKTVGAITTGAATIGIPGAFPIGAKIAGARAGAEVVERGAQAARIAGEEILTGPSRMTVMERVAKNQKNPEWLRKAANNSIVSSPITQGAAELGLETGKGAVKSAAVGAGLGYVASGGEEEGIGGGAVIGGGLGAVGGAIKGLAEIPGKKAIAKQGDVNRLFARQADLGLDVNKIADYVRKDNRPFLDAATLQMMAPDIQVEFHGRDSFMMSENAGINAAGVVKAIPDKSGTTRLLVNMDDRRASGDTVKHEIMHAIMKSPAINKAEGRMAVMSEYGEEGLRKFGNEYARRLLEGERQGRGAPTEAEVRAKANELREGSQRSEPGAGDLDWIADEVLAEQFVGEFRGKDLDSLRRKTIPGTNLLSLQEGYLAPVGRLLNKFGIDTTGPKPTNIDTLFKDNPLVPSKQLRELTTRWFRDRDKYLDGLDKAEKQKDVVLVPGAGNKNLANNPAIKFTRNRKTNLEENDFAVKFPDGTVRAKDPASILAVDKARVADVARMYDPNAVLERGSPEFGVKIQSDGKPYVGGPKLPEAFYNLDSFNDFTKEVAKTLEDSRQEGRTFAVWYQKVGTGEDGSWAQSVKRGLGNIKVGQSELSFLGWRLSKAGNILAQAVDVSALRGRMLDFARSGKGRINEIWGGDLASYEKDVMKYLDNHANNRPGDEGLGTAKRDAINYLFGITNVANKGVNPMYAEGRPPGSLVKSYRLDRIANSRDTGRTGFFIDYQKQAMNLAPGESIRPAQSDGEYMAAINRGDMETVQKMVDEAAASSGYNLTNQWHQSKESANTFDPRYKTELSSMGFHFGTKEQAEFRSTQYDYRGGLKPSLRRFSLKIKNPYEVTHMGSFAPDHLAEKMITDGILSESAYERLPGFTEQEIGSKLVKILKKNGYDGLVYKNEREGAGLSYVAFDPSQIKSADPVTYDARGNVIPLSMRFNPESKDIRFSPATPEPKQFAPVTGSENRNLEINRKDRELMARVPLKPEDKQIIKNASVGKTKLSSGTRAQEKMIESRVREVKGRFPQASGWAKIELADVEVTKPKKAGEDPKINPVFKTVPYSFEKDPNTGKDTAATHAKRVEDHSNKVVSELMKVVDRARSGDKNAQKILGHKTWYRGMNEILRRTFGGVADYFADLLGAFSPNTSVDINWRFGVEALSKVTRGDYDSILSKVDEWVKSGKTISDYKKEGNPMILQENQKLFGMNSDNGMIAMLDLWRQVQAGQAPKARNFALNLVGQSLKATIDVWAARFLQRMAGLERVPTVAEGGVSGNVLADTSRVGGQFGYGQEVFESAVQKLRKSGIEDLKDLTAPDLQAIVWFLEKEIWAENNWTSKTGEGGSFETEADLTQPSRYVIGLSQETPEVKPTAQQQASFASDIRNTFAEAPGIIATKIKDSIGAFMGATERSFDAEFIVTPDFDPSKLIEVTASKAMSSGQKNAFVSRVLGPNEDNANARPGIEIYLRKKGSMGDVNALAKQVSEAGIDGFTMIVDPRAKVAGVPDEFIGIRYQYVPEFSGDKNWKANAVGIMEKLEDLADGLMSQSEVAFANVVEYDTLVLGEKDYGNFNTETGTGYTEGRGASWIGRADSARNEAAARGIESGKQAQRPTGFQRVGNESRQPAKADLESEVKKRAIKEELLSPAKLLTRKRGAQ